jgi:hypothetical protein
LFDLREYLTGFKKRKEQRRKKATEKAMEKLRLEKIQKRAEVNKKKLNKNFK